MATRQCTVEFVNNGSEYTLINPNVFTYSGSCGHPLPPILRYLQSGSALFVKTPDTACGAVGVLTYDLQNESTKKCDGKMAVMYSVPYDFNLYSNWFAVGVFDEKRECDYSLYEEMYYKEGKEFKRGKAKEYLTYPGEAVTIKATMSDTYTPVINIQVSSSSHKCH